MGHLQHSALGNLEAFKALEAIRACEAFTAILSLGGFRAFG